MKKYISVLIIGLSIVLTGCSPASEKKYASSPDDIPFTWNNANIYFLLTDRFNNANPGNDVNFGRKKVTAVNRGFMGGDFAGITKKIKEGYFNKLGISAIWMSPFVEQNHGMVNEGTGDTYAYHGYWAQDWTAIDPNFGSEEELAELVETAHKHGIRVVMDIVVNHTGPVTDLDPVWPDAWVRTSPKCQYKGYKSTVSCTLVDNLPDIKTESEENVGLPPQLLAKWKKEGRLEKELAELDAFFEETGYARAPKYYIIKWLTDYIRKFGIDGYRLDTAKHTEEEVWTILRKEADKAYLSWRSRNPDIFPENDHFYMVAEVYGYNLSGGRWYDYGDTLVDFYSAGIDQLINFELRYDAAKSYEEIFAKYSNILHSQLNGNGVLNYLSSHDDGSPFDQMREKPMLAGTILLLSPGASQIYYGDESSRVLFTENAVGDANLRSFMNWSDLEKNNQISGYNTQNVLSHYQKIGQFRRNHPSVGAGNHELISTDPYIFKRTYVLNGISDVVVCGLELKTGAKTIPVKGTFKNGTELYDSYSGIWTTVHHGVVTINSEATIVLLGLF